MPRRNSSIVTAVGLILVLALTEIGFAQAQGTGRSRPRTRRTQRVVPMKEVQLASPDGKVTFTLGSNPERLTYSVMLENVAVIEPSPLDMRMDGYDLSSGVTFNNLEVYSLDETDTGPMEVASLPVSQGNSCFGCVASFRHWKGNRVTCKWASRAHNAPQDGGIYCVRVSPLLTVTLTP